MRKTIYAFCWGRAHARAPGNEFRILSDAATLRLGSCRLVLRSYHFMSFFYHEDTYCCTVATAAGGKYKWSGQQQDAGVYISHKVNKPAICFQRHGPLLVIDHLIAPNI